LRKLLSTWISPAPGSCLQPGALALVPDGLQELLARIEIGFFFFRRSLMTPSQRRYCRRDSVSANSGTGGALLDGRAQAVRTESPAALPAAPASGTRLLSKQEHRPSEGHSQYRASLRRLDSSALNRCQRAPGSCAFSLDWPESDATTRLTAPGGGGIAAVLVLDLPFLEPRSPMVTRCGTPISSQSANIAPGRSPRSSRSHPRRRPSTRIQLVGSALTSGCGPG
jgi:hypothetical protein